MNFSIYSLVICITMNTNYMLTAGEAEIVMRFERFVNPGGKGDNGNCCDGRSIFCEINGCDHFFTLCLDSADGSNSMGACAFGSKVTDRVKNEDSITFGSRIGDTTNRFTFRMDTWPGSAKLKVKVEDRDKINGHDYVDTLVSVLTQSPYQVEPVPHTLRDRCTLQLKMEVRCLEYWWGEDCATYCRPRDSHSGHYNCSINGSRICLPGWEGDRCDEEINECASSPCNPLGGTCVDSTNAFLCTCLLGYSGVTCHDDVDECQNETLCGGNGNCFNVPGSYICNCTIGFTGDHCETDIDECSSSPCVHSNASCVDGVNGFSCLCPPGFTGELCEVDIDECINHGCMNNATCVDRVGYHGCKCALGYQGIHCEIDIDECASSPCHTNASRCQDNVGWYKCFCNPGWTGIHCDVEINECENNSCVYGKCNDLFNGYVCDCTEGFGGRFCDVNIDECINVTCPGNHSFCVDRIAGYECQCLEGYIGENCSKQIDICTQQTCLNNGTCVQKAQGYTCICDEKWNGTICNESVDICANSPCHPKGSEDCLLNNGSYECFCMKGWRGEYCDSQLPANCLCPLEKHQKFDRTCFCTNYTGENYISDQWDNAIDSKDEQSAILFVKDVDSDKAETLVDFLRSYTTFMLPVSYDDVTIDYQLDSCHGDKGEDITIFIFEIEIGGRRVPYSLVDSIFEQLLHDNTSKAHIPVKVYSGEDCFEAGQMISAQEGGFPYWIILCAVGGISLLLILLFVVWRVYRTKTKSLNAHDDPILVQHKLRQSRLNSEAFILSNESVAESFTEDGVCVQDDVTDHEDVININQDGQLSEQQEDSEAQPNVPRCFVNLMYEDLPETHSSN